MVGDYRKANIRFVAIGLDTVEGTARSLDRMPAGERFGFPMLSDRKQRVFREWMAFDDFEHMPLHGTYLIDGKGRLRWQDIRYLPFSEPKWLLDECSRLLEQESE